jgi:recombination protein RecT
MANELSAQKTQKMGIASYLGGEAVKKNIANVVGEKNTTRFISSVVSAVQTNPTLKECSNGSILSAALLGEALNLTPSPQLGQYYMVPYNNKDTKGKDAQFQIGYKGYIQLAIRSGQYRKITVSEVKEGELKSYNPITEEFILEPVMDFAKREKLPVVGYYAMFELVNGFRKELYWSKERMEKHATTYSSGYRSDVRNKTKYTFWSKNFDDMAKKTLLRQLINKWGIMSIDLQTAMANDMAVINESGEPIYVDNVADVQETVQTEITENANKEEFVVADVVEG